MKLLFYSKKAESKNDRLRQAIESVLPIEQIEICTTFDCFFHRLHQPTYNLMAAVLAVDNQADLSNLASIRDLLGDMRILLVLPDQRADTKTIGFRLWPRFMCEAHDDYKDLIKVIGKLARNQPTVAVDTNNLSSEQMTDLNDSC